MNINHNMINILLKRAALGHRKTADDMALFKGQVDYSNRQGLEWHRFVPGQFQGTESLPPDALEKIELMMNRFRAQFKQYAVNPKTNQIYSDFRGMLWVIYAHDNAVPSEDMANLPTELQQTAEFVNQTGVMLTPEGNQNDSIGMPFWISYNAHAYKGLFPDEIMEDQPARAEEIRSVTNTRQIEQAEQNGWAYGNLVVKPVGQGASLFLDKSGESTPLIRGQSYGAMREYFKDKITINSDVSLPEGIMGRVVPAPLKRPRKGRLEEQAISEQAVRDQSNSVRQQAIAQGSLYQLRADQQGALFVTNRSTKESHYLNQSQVQSLVNEQFLNKPLYIVPGVQPDLSSFGDRGQEITKKRVGQWRMSPQLVQHLETSDGPYSFNKLRELRNFMGEMHLARHGSEIHTPLEGIKVVMIGPAFTRPQEEGGVTKTSPQFATHKTLANPELETSDFVNVEQVTWVIVANEIKKNAQLKNPWSQTSQTYDKATSAPEAIEKAKKYTGETHIISEIADSVFRADAALRAAITSGTGQPQGEVAPADQALQNLPAAPQAAPAQPASANAQPAYQPPRKPRMRYENGRLVPVEDVQAKQMINRLLKNAKF